MESSPILGFLHLRYALADRTVEVWILNNNISARRSRRDDVKPWQIVFAITVSAICVVSVFIYALHNPTPTPVESSYSDKKETTKKKDNASGYAGETKSNPLFVNIVPPEATPESRQHEQYERHEKPSLDRGLTYGTWSLVLVTGFLFVVTTFLAIYTYRLWSAGEKNSQRQLRAYVALDDIYFRWITDETDPKMRKRIVDKHEDGGFPRPRIRVKNFGHTPAHDVMVRINGTMVTPEIIKDTNTTKLTFKRTYDGGRGYPAPEQMLAPSQVYGMWVHLKDRFRFNPKADNPVYDPNTNTLVVWGFILYEDVFDRWWLTNFCYTYDGFNRFLPYRLFNKEHGPFEGEQARDKAINRAFDT